MARAQESADKPEATGSGTGPLGMAMLAISSIVAAAGTMFVLSPGMPAGSEPDCASGLTEGETVVPLASFDRAYVDIDEILVTIGQSPADRYLKLKLFVVTKHDKTGEVKKVEPMLRDAFIGYLRAVELSDFEDPAFYAELRRQLARRAELVLGEAGTDGVLITEFLLR